MIRETLSRVGAEFLEAREGPLAGNPTADFLRHDAAAAVRDALTTPNLITEGSPGHGNWAVAPWIAVFDPRVTESARRGYYAVYLFDAEMKTVTLSLNQGTYEVHKEFGRDAIEELKRRAAIMRARVPEYRDRFSPAAIDLRSPSALPRRYEAGHALGATYPLADLPFEDLLVSDLRDIVELYLLLVARGGHDTLEEIPTDELEDENTEIQERRRYRLHRKLDRNPKASKAAKKIHGHTCQGCGLDFAKMYGEAGRDFIEAHHLKPLAEIPENQTVTMDPQHDFAVLCSNCHSMMHRRGGPRTLEELRGLVHVPDLRDFFNGLT